MDYSKHASRVKTHKKKQIKTNYTKVSYNFFFALEESLLISKCSFGYLHN